MSISRIKKIILIGCLLLMNFSLFLPCSIAQTMPCPAKPGPKETCPVCGMFVSLYPSWVVMLAQESGEAIYFDGPKDMFKYYLEPEKYQGNQQNRNKKEKYSLPIKTSVFVTDYYTQKHIDGTRAFYVIGSDVMGPMGHELVPMLTAEDAQEFLIDHKATQILKFEEVTLQVLNSLDKVGL